MSEFTYWYSLARSVRRPSGVERLGGCGFAAFHTVAQLAVLVSNQGAPRLRRTTDITIPSFALSAVVCAHAHPPTLTASFLSVGLMRLPPSPRASSRCSWSEVSRSRTCAG